MNIPESACDSKGVLLFGVSWPLVRSTETQQLLITQLDRPQAIIIYYNNAILQFVNNREYTRVMG